MLPLQILFADITIVVCLLGAVIFSILYFSDWGEKSGHDTHESDHGHH